jgi:hypothetical protein
MRQADTLHARATNTARPLRIAARGRAQVAFKCARSDRPASGKDTTPQIRTAQADRRTDTAAASATACAWWKKEVEMTEPDVVEDMASLLAIWQREGRMMAPEVVDLMQRARDEIVALRERAEEDLVRYAADAFAHARETRAEALEEAAKLMAECDTPDAKIVAERIRALKEKP